MKESAYRVGQVWHYKSRVGEEGSTFIIVKIEFTEAVGNIIHISIEGLRFNNPYNQSSITDTISHLPLSESAITMSATTMVSEIAEQPNYEEGYNEWRQAFDRGQAGIWTIPIADCIEAIEQAMNTAFSTSNESIN